MLAVAAFVALGVVTATPTVAAVPAHSNYVNPVLLIGENGESTGVASPERVAVDQARHTLLVTDTGHSRVAVYEVIGQAATFQQEIGVGTLSAPFGIALDESNNFLYVSDAGTNRIERYTVSNTTPAVYTLDTNYQGPSLGSGPGQVGSFAAALSVDPTTHDLLVADSGNHLVSRYTQNGAFVGSFGAGALEATFSGPTDIAAAPDGTIYVTDLSGDPTYGKSRIGHYSSTGDLLDVPGPMASPLAVTVNAANGILTAASFDQTTFLATIYGFSGDNPAGAETDQSTPIYNYIRGAAVDDVADGNLYVVRNGGFPAETGLYLYSALEAPGVQMGAISGVTKESAEFSGLVDPGGEEAVPHFEYSSTPSEPNSWVRLADLPPVASPLPPGASAVPVAGEATGLQPAQEYSVRLVASNAQTSSRSGLGTFTTLGVAPDVTTAVANDVTETRATFPGTVLPNGQQTTYHFEYGTTAAYGSQTANTPLGEQRTPQLVSSTVGGLMANTIYHYRIVATNPSGIAYGQDQTLVTDIAGSPVRGYEEVTPAEKGQANLFDTILPPEDPPSLAFSADGDSVLFRTDSGLLPGIEATSAPNRPTYFTMRSATGWASRQVDVPFTTRNSAFPQLFNVLAVTPDLRSSVVFSDHALASGAVAGQANIYLEDNQTGALSLAGVMPSALLGPLGFSGQALVAASADGSRVFVSERQAAPPGFPNNGEQRTYELRDGNIAVPTVDEQGTVVPPPGIQVAPVGHGLIYGQFVRVDARISAYSASEIPNDPTVATQVAARWTGDGQSIIFRSSEIAPLTAEAPEQEGDIYRYTLAAPVGHHLQYIGNGTVDGVSQDGSTVVFDTGSSLLAWRAGRTLTLQNPYSDPGVSQQELSSDGRYFAVTTNSPLTADPTVNTRACGASCYEVYLFDIDAGSLACASCRADGVAPAGNASTGIGGVAVSPEGEVFFSTPTSLVSGDNNAASDVYAFRGGHVHLISRAMPGMSSTLGGATPSGDDVYFFTDERLVGQDTDSAVDIYDARDGGGIAAQNPSPPQEPCVPSACRGEVSGAPPGATPGSQGPSTRQASRPQPAKITIPRSKVSVSGAGVRMTIHVSTPGRLRISGRYLSTRTRSAAAAKTYKVSVPLTKSAKQVYRREHRLVIAVRVTLTPASGAAAVDKFTRTLHG